MFYVFRSRFRNLTLNEIIEELDNIDEGCPIPDEIHIFPPETYNADLTDEDSGDENFVSLQNLPGRQLRATAEVYYEDSVSEDGEDDDVPLAHIAKHKCPETIRSSPGSSSPEPSTSLAPPATSVTRLLVSKNKTYKWHNRDIRPTHGEWRSKGRVPLKEKPMHFFDLFFQPATIKAYNENMGGVDRSDQNIGLYRTSIRGKKWYLSLISHFLDMALHNAWQLYQLNSGEYDHLKFRRTIATGLLETFKKKDSRKSTRTSQGLHETSRYDYIGHIIMYRPNQLRCSICHKNASFYCIKCNLSLHPKFCFNAYHTPL